MKQKQISDYFNVTKKTSSIKVKDNNLSQTITLKCKQKKQTLKSQLNTTKKVSQKIVKPRAKRFKKMASSQKPRYVQKAVITISDDDDDGNDVVVVEPSTQYLTQEPSQNTSTQDDTQESSQTTGMEMNRELSMNSYVLENISKIFNMTPEQRRLIDEANSKVCMDEYLDSVEAEYLKKIETETKINNNNNNNNNSNNDNNNTLFEVKQDDDDDGDVVVEPSTQYLTQEPSQSTSAQDDTQESSQTTGMEMNRELSMDSYVLENISKIFNMTPEQRRLIDEASSKVCMDEYLDSVEAEYLKKIETETKINNNNNDNNNTLFEVKQENSFDNNNCTNISCSTSKLNTIVENDENNQSFDRYIDTIIKNSFSVKNSLLCNEYRRKAYSLTEDHYLMENDYLDENKNIEKESEINIEDECENSNTNENHYLMNDNYQDENKNIEKESEINIEDECENLNTNESERKSFIRVKSVNTINNLYDKSFSQLASESSSQLNINNNKSQLLNYTNEISSQSPIKGSQYLMWENSPLKRKLDDLNSSDYYSSPSKKSQSPWKLSSPIKSQESLVRNHSLSPRKILTGIIQDKSIIPDAIENLNFYKQHVIVENNFNLDEIYSSKFIMSYGPIDTKTSTLFDINDINIPKSGSYREKDAERLFMLIIDVFSNPINPGYFTEYEIDTIYSMMTLTIGAQILLSRMIKRKIKWIKKRDLDKEEIDGSIDLQLKELIDRKLLNTQGDNYELDVVLEMMSRDDISLVCKMMKVSIKGTKAVMIQKLIELSNKKPLFNGMKTPRQALQESINSINGECIKVSDITMNIIKMLTTIIYPIQDPEKGISDVFYLLHEVHFSGNKLFPNYTNKRYPIFKNRKHIIDFIVAKNQWTIFLNLLLQKNKDDSDWHSITKIGDISYNKLINIFNNYNEEKYQLNNNLPSHIKRFMPIYIWGKILFSSVDAYKKINNYDKAIQILEFLIDKRSYIQGKFIKWYVELSQLELNRMKNLEKSAQIIMTALSIPNLTDSDKTELIQRAKILSTRTKNISLDTKNLMKQQVDLHCNNFSFNTKQTIVTAYMMEGLVGNKSTWQLNIDNINIGYSNVEKVAIQHYMKYENFTNGIHCEGSLAVTIFTCLFWNEIYNVFVPGAFVCSYQPAPLDLFGSKFIDNRDGKIDDKIQQIKNMNNDEFLKSMVNCYTTYRNYDCLIQNIVDDPIEFREIIESLGKTGVIAISSKIASNLSVWQSGFPDLFLWNRNNKTCKIVEVKGPGDTLSVKQKLWIDYLQKNNIPVDVCHVQAANKY